MARIIPGVQVTVVKDVVPKQLAPSGILGAAGLVEHNAPGQDLVRIANWNDLVEKLGLGTAHSMPELRQALENGVFSVVAVPVASQSAAAAGATVALAEGPGQALQLQARAKGTWANGLKVETALRSRAGETIGFDLTLARPDGGSEAYRNLSVQPGDSKYFARVLESNSSVALVPMAIRERTNASAAVSLELIDSGAITAVSLVQAEGKVMILDVDISADTTEVAVTLNEDDGGLIQRYQRTLPNTRAGLLELLSDLAELSEYVVLSGRSYPAVAKTTLTGGVDAGTSEYVDAVNKLVDAPEVDMVLASVQDFSNVANVISVYSGVIAHCEASAGESKGRIGFGQVPAVDGSDKPYSVDLQVEMASNLVSDRFALISPFGTVGAVIGRIGALSYFQSPTFKTLGGLGVLARDLGVADQRGLLQGNVVPVATERGRGTIVVRGLTTDGDQISVRRVADRAVRGVKQIGELFIGRLNNADQRAALKGALSAFLLQMEKDGALVPSTDGSDPAFKVDVYSSQQDFALGIVRIDMAVRPVRAIDFIYATVLVQV